MNYELKFASFTIINNSKNHEKDYLAQSNLTLKPEVTVAEMRQKKLL